MLCQKCQKNQANTHFTIVENGAKKEYDLCSDCAWELGSTAFSPFAFGKLFSQNIAGSGNQLTCSHCGTTLSELQQSSLLGCEHCYDDLYSGIEPILRNVQRGLVHTGRIPSGYEAKAEIAGEHKEESIPTEESEITLLQKQLDNAIANEEYEKAAEIRDQIKLLKETGEKS